MWHTVAKYPLADTGLNGMLKLHKQTGVGREMSFPIKPECQRGAPDGHARLVLDTHVSETVDVRRCWGPVRILQGLPHRSVVMLR